MLTRLHRKIAEAGIPILGVSEVAGGFRIDFEPQATPEQRTQARELADDFASSPHLPRSWAEILADVESLSAEDRRILVNALLTERIVANPYWAIDQGIDLPG